MQAGKAVAVALLSLGLALGWLRGITPAHAQFVKSLEQDQSTFYRLKVKLAYKGEPQDFDIVVGCNVRITNYLGGGNSYEVGLIPSVFGRRMSDGKGLVVRPPDACKGETTANGHVQPDLLPVVVVYDDADTLSFGTAYLSEDAYEGPLSVLRFGGATIEQATRAEFDEFRRTQTNLVTRQQYHSGMDSDAGLKEKHLTRLVHSFGHLCQAYVRFLIPDEVRPLVQQAWPDSHPDFWRPFDGKAEVAIRNALRDSQSLQSDRKTDPPRPMRTWQFGTANTGVPTRAGGGQMFPQRGLSYPAAVYPATTDFAAHRWPADWTEWPKFIAGKDVNAVTDIDFRGGQKRGFAYCWSDIRPTPEQRPVLESFNRVRRVFRVDGQEVALKGDTLVGDTWIFQRDESVLINFWLNLESTRGDV